MNNTRLLATGTATPPSVTGREELAPTRNPEPVR
jgi:hypothetical protein